MASCWRWRMAAEKGVATPTQQITKGTASVVDADAPSDDGQQLRELAVKQLERKRRFRMHAISYAIACVALIVIWAITE